MLGTDNGVGPDNRTLSSNIIIKVILVYANNNNNNGGEERVANHSIVCPICTLQAIVISVIIIIILECRVVSRASQASIGIRVCT